MLLRIRLEKNKENINEVCKKVKNKKNKCMCVSNKNKV